MVTLDFRAMLRAIEVFQRDLTRLMALAEVASRGMVGATLQAQKWEQVERPVAESQAEALAGCGASRTSPRRRPVSSTPVRCLSASRTSVRTTHVQCSLLGAGEHRAQLSRAVSKRCGMLVVPWTIRIIPEKPKKVQRGEFVAAVLKQTE
ncbi:MAG: hypothetical protein ACRENK_16405 [Gemmatimonadaceae bacterium]